MVKTSSKRQTRGRMLKNKNEIIGTIDRKGPRKANAAHRDYTHSDPENSSRRVRQCEGEGDQNTATWLQQSE